MSVILSLDDELDDEESMARTVERRPTRLPTVRLTTLRLAVTDRLGTLSSASRAKPAFRPVPEITPQMAVGAALVLSCIFAGMLALALDRPRAASARTPHVATVLGAHDEITDLPATAPQKQVSEPDPEPAVPPAAPHRGRSFGFRHLGADRHSSAHHPFS